MKVRSNENEDSDGGIDKKPAAKIPEDAVDSDGEDDGTASVLEEEDEQTGSARGITWCLKKRDDSDVPEEEDEQTGSARRGSIWCI
jgi:hypothetical protein